MGYFRLNFSREQSLELMDEPDRRLLLADEQMRIAPRIHAPDVREH